MRFLVRLRPSSNPIPLAAVRTIARTTGVDLRNPKWTSYGALEVDLFAPSRNDVETFLAAAAPIAPVEWLHDLSISPPYRPPEQLFREARDYFNAERYWECHETLEEEWRRSSGAKKSFLQGAILVCAAFVHHQKGEDHVALAILRRAQSRLDSGAPADSGIDVESLRRLVEETISSGRFEPFPL